MSLRINKKALTPHHSALKFSPHFLREKKKTVLAVAKMNRTLRFKASKTREEIQNREATPLSTDSRKFFNSILILT